MLVYFQCLTHTAVYAKICTYAHRTRAEGQSQKKNPNKQQQQKEKLFQDWKKLN